MDFKTKQQTSQHLTMRNIQRVIIMNQERSKSIIVTFEDPKTIPFGKIVHVSKFGAFGD